MGNYSAAVAVEIPSFTTTLDADQVVNDVKVTAVLHGPSGMTYQDEADLGTPTPAVQEATLPAAQQVLANAQALLARDFGVGATVALQSITTTRAYSTAPVAATLIVTLPDATTRTVVQPSPITAEVLEAIYAGTEWVEQAVLAHYDLDIIFGGAGIGNLVFQSVVESVGPAGDTVSQTTT